MIYGREIPTEELKPIIADNITKLRRSHNMTQLELAAKLNYTDKAVSKWERGESVPDISVLKNIANLFGVSVDYLLQADHETPTEVSDNGKTRKYGFITGMSVVLVWLIATLAFVVVDSVRQSALVHWLAFLYAIPVSMIVWLIMNSIWFNRRRNYMIISFLMWSVLIAVYVSFVAFDIHIWQIFMLGIPGQGIIVMWSRIKKKSVPQSAITKSDTSLHAEAD